MGLLAHTAIDGNGLPAINSQSLIEVLYCQRAHYRQDDHYVESLEVELDDPNFSSWVDVVPREEEQLKSAQVSRQDPGPGLMAARKMLTAYQKHYSK
jgi:hypothetical protein